MNSTGSVAATIHDVLIILRDALAPFVVDCLGQEDPSRRKLWWDIVDERRLGKLRVLPRNPVEWTPDELLNTLDNNWVAFRRRTKLRFISPKEKPKADDVAQGWVKHLVEFRNRTMHQDKLTDNDLNDFLRIAEWLLTAAQASEAVEEIASIRNTIKIPTDTIPGKEFADGTRAAHPFVAGSESQPDRSNQSPQQSVRYETAPDRPRRSIVLPRPITAREQAVRVRVVQEINRNATENKPVAIPWAPFIAQHPVGSEVNGKVRDVLEFGIVVDLAGNFDGFVQLSDVAWNRPGEEAIKDYRKGDGVRVKVLGVDVDKKHVSLGIKQTVANPWAAFVARHTPGSEIQGEVRTVTQEGLWIILPGNIDGLVYMSDIDGNRPGEEAIKDYRKGDGVRVKVLYANLDKERIGLSIKEIRPERRWHRSLHA